MGDPLPPHHILGVVSTPAGWRSPPVAGGAFPWLKLFARMAGLLWSGEGEGGIFFEEGSIPLGSLTVSLASWVSYYSYAVYQHSFI